ncbi:hypothetical protein [Treponema zioleckii]|uniref:hypothetical protein n=1 Tax=Treponema zioleckii TaxID=331680 RepID=UPI00168A5D6B|nr:hypothetical protein [Treponema zioleckii]
MNSIWNKNISLFKKRFPLLAETLLKNHFAENPDEIPEDFLAPLEILPSKTGVLTARENGKYLHSFYNPLREAEQTAESAKKGDGAKSNKTIISAAFLGFGFGYAALQYDKKKSERHGDSR